MNKRPFFTLFIIVLAFVSCQDSALDIDVSSIDLTLTTHRADEIVFDTNMLINERVAQLEKLSPFFFKEYCESILRLGPSDSKQTHLQLEAFAKDPFMQKSEAEIKNSFDQKVLYDFDIQLQEGFRHCKYHFPALPTPSVIYYHSGFNYGIYPTDSLLAIGLDFYLGPQSPSVKQLPPNIFPNYQRNKMRPDYLVTDAMKGWLFVHFQDLYRGDNLLEEIIFYGKMMYALDAALPETPDSLKINYSSQELSWCFDHEQSIWKELAKQEVLFESRAFEIRKWTADGPFTSAGNVPQESPARIGIWMGWQMVRDFMRKNKTLSVSELLYNASSQEILRQYNPK